MLFNEFTAPHYDDWRNKALEELDGADFDKTLVWKPDGEFSISPIHLKRDNSPTEIETAIPGLFPYLRGFSTLGSKNNPPLVAQNSFEKDLNKANIELTQSLASGQSVISVNNEIKTLAEAELLLKGIPLASYPLFLHSTRPENSYQALVSFLQQQEMNGSEIQGQIFFDPLEEILSTGKIPQNNEALFVTTADFVHLVEKHTPRLKPLCSIGNTIHNSGADVVQELAYTISKAIALMDGLTNHGLSVGEAAKAMSLCFCVGTNLALEIAKLRAARVLWATMIRQWNVAADCSVEIHIESSHWNKTLFDPYVNVLRGAIECLAGYIGGVQSITLEPFDSLSGDVSDRSNRLARNTQLILEAESYLSEVIDPAAGSYYLEELTGTIAAKAWSRVQEIENEGGFLAAFQKGHVQADVSATASRRKKNTSQRTNISIGVNNYPNLTERPDGFHPLEELEIIHDSITEDFIQVEPLHPDRAVENLERIRLSVLAHSNRPTVLFALYGPSFWRRARATFSTGFLGIAGLSNIETIEMESVDETTQKAKLTNADIVVLCSDDESYAATVPGFVQAIRAVHPETIILVAGCPKDSIALLVQSGVNDFIHMKSDAENVFLALMKKLGIQLLEGRLS